MGCKFIFRKQFTLSLQYLTRVGIPQATGGSFYEFYKTLVPQKC